MDVGEKYFNFAASAKKVSDFDLSSLSVQGQWCLSRVVLTMGTKYAQ